MVTRKEADDAKKKQLYDGKKIKQVEKGRAINGEKSKPKGKGIPKSVKGN